MRLFERSHFSANNALLVRGTRFLLYVVFNDFMEFTSVFATIAEVVNNCQYCGGCQVTESDKAGEASNAMQKLPALRLVLNEKEVLLSSSKDLAFGIPAKSFGHGSQPLVFFGTAPGSLMDLRRKRYLGC